MSKTFTITFALDEDIEDIQGKILDLVIDGIGNSSYKAKLYGGDITLLILDKDKN